MVAPVLITYPYSVAGNDVVAYMWHPEDGPDSQPIPTATDTVDRREDFPFDGELGPPCESTLEYNYTRLVYCIYSVHVRSLYTYVYVHFVHVDVHTHMLCALFSLTSCS